MNISSLSVRRGVTFSMVFLVIVGFDRHGDVIVNDPAAANAQDGRRTYRREQIEQIWLRRKAGTAYVLESLSGATPSSSTLRESGSDRPKNGPS